MTRMPPALRSAQVWLAFIGIEVVALVLRLAVLPLPGHSGDVTVISRWAENLALHGPPSFYQWDNAIYPSLLPILWPVGLALDGEALFTAVKGLSIPFDLVTAGLLFVVVGARVGAGAGLLAAAVFAWNPAPIVGGPIWGQVDAVGSLLFLAALVSLATDRYALAGGLAVLAGLAKPQFGLVVLPLVVVAGQRIWQGRDWRPAGAAVLGGAVAFVAIGLFAGLSPFRWVELFLGAAEFQPDTSLNAINIWGVVIGFEIDDAPYVAIGGLLLVAGLALSLVPLRRGHDLATVLAVGMMIAFAFYFLPTRVHERYLFPALAVAAPFAAVSRASLAAYLALSAGFALALLRALVLTTAFSLPRDIEDFLVSPAMIWLLAILLWGSALTLIRLTLSGAGDPLNRPTDSSAAVEAGEAAPAGASAAPG